MGDRARPSLFPSRLAGACVLAVIGLSVLAGCGRSAKRPTSGASPTCPARLAQVRADTYASVAMRIYHEEVYGSPNADAVAVIAPLPGLLRGLAAGDYALARRTLNGQPVRHAVRERVVRAGRVLVDVGLRYVVAGHPRALRAANGRYLGAIEVSIQDVIGYIKLVHRLTGTQIVVRGSVGHHAKSSLAGGLGEVLPPSGPVSVSGRRYTASSFHRLGFAGEQLSIWILAPS